MSEKVKKFPNALTEGSYIGPFKAEVALIWVIGLFVFLLSREPLVFALAGALHWFNGIVAERFEHTTALQVIYSLGFPVATGSVFDGAFDKEYLG